MSYKDRSALFVDNQDKWEGKGGNSAYKHMIVIDGVIGGTWQQTVKNKKIIVETSPYFPLNKKQSQALDKAVKRYISFFENEYPLKKKP